MKFPYKIERVNKSPVEKKTTPFSALALTTPRGRRRTSLLVIVTGLVVSHIYVSGVVGELVERLHQGASSFVSTVLPPDAPWSVGVPSP